MPTSLTVAAIIREPAATIRRFLNWYLDQGADRILLFLDDPEDPLWEELRLTPKVEPVRCTPDFWAGVGILPDKPFPRRQNFALTAAYHTIAEGWLLNVDADELMSFQGRTLAEAVRQFPQEALCVRVATAEQVHLSDGDEAFRLPIARTAVDRVYREIAPFFRQRLGLLGHADGKAFHRAGQTGIRLRQHWAEDNLGNQVEALRLGHAEGAHLLHLAAPSYDTWREKLDWRLSSANLTGNLRVMLQQLRDDDPNPEAAYRELWSRLYCLAPEQQAQLEAEGGLLHLKI